MNKEELVEKLVNMIAMPDLKYISNITNEEEL